jgi:protein-disulfide isomerase
MRDYMESRGSSCCKLGIAVSVLALGVAAVSYFCPKKEPAVPDTTFNERVRSAVIDVIKQNPQLLMDAMGEGIARQRSEAAKQLSSDILSRKAEIMKQGIRLGKPDSKVLIVCFFDPLCKHCVDFQKSMLKLIESDKGIEFVLLPVAVLGEDSVTFGKIYNAVYAKAPGMILKFIKAIVESDTMDKSAMEDAMRKAGLSPKDIEANLRDYNEAIENNGTLAEKLKVPVVPAIFVIKGRNVQMVQATGTEQILQAVDETADDQTTSGMTGKPAKEVEQPSAE